MNLTTAGIRLQHLALSDEQIVQSLLAHVRVGYLGLVDGDEPYVVPLNYVWLREAIYFHGAEEGRKARLLAQEPRATFTVAEEMGTITHPVPAKTDTAYCSAMVFGRVQCITDLDESTAAMQALLDKYVPGYYNSRLQSGHVASYVSKAGSHVSVCKLPAERVTAKRNEDSLQALFYPGKTQRDDHVATAASATQEK